jgi:glycosyltransferase involved in cell wall biosynthesis
MAPRARWIAFSKQVMASYSAHHDPLYDMAGKATSSSPTFVLPAVAGLLLLAGSQGHCVMIRAVLYYTDSDSFGGLEKAMLQHIQGLDRNDWRPVLAHRPQDGMVGFLKEASNLGVRLVEVPHLPLGLVGAQQVPAFVKVLHEERPAVFHAHLSWPLACKWGLVAAFVERVPAVVATLHLWVDTAYTPASRWQQSMIASRMGKYIAVSQDVAHKLQDVFNVHRSKVQVIHSAVDYQHYTESADLKPPAMLTDLGGRPIVMTVARLDRQKGLPTLLEAAARVPEAVFVVVGEGPDRSDLEVQRHELNLENRVIFAGFQQDIRAWLRHCDLFVLPSLYEGMPISLLEAMASGKPVIASAIPGNKEVVTHAETGWLVPPGDAGVLADAIRHILANQTLALQLASAGRERVKQEFSIQQMNQQVMQVYAGLLEKRREGSQLHG